MTDGWPRAVSGEYRYMSALAYWLHILVHGTRTGWALAIGGPYRVHPVQVYQDVYLPQLRRVERVSICKSGNVPRPVDNSGCRNRPYYFCMY